MSQSIKSTSKFIESFCKTYGIPGAAHPLVEGYATILDAQMRPMMEGAMLDRIKGFGKNLLLPVLASVCLGSGAAHAAGTDQATNPSLAKCKNLTQCAAQITDMKKNGQITEKEMQQIKRIAENNPNVEYCKVFPRGILCKLKPEKGQGFTVSGATFTPTQHIDELDDNFQSITFYTVDSPDASSKFMDFNTDVETTSFRASKNLYDADDTRATVTEDDGFTEKKEQEFSYDTVLDYINNIYDICKH
jgi:hypothetical protein